MAIILLGTLDTKGSELGFVRDRLRSNGLTTMVVDVGSRESPRIEPDVRRDAVFRRAGVTVAELLEKGDRGLAVAKAAEGAAALVAELCSRGDVEGIFGLGGSAGTTIASAAMRAAPFGIPKVLVSTLASGQTRPYVGGSDLVLVPSVADIAGLNGLTRVVLANATDALAGMVIGRAAMPVRVASGRPVVTATMFGVTTPCVTRARDVLEAAGCEVLIFHATGVGGESMERLMRDGQVAAVLDLTTTELADDEVGGILSAGPHRLETAGRLGLPQVVSLGALDMVNFGPRETVPERFRGRLFHVHNPSVTLMRTSVEESRALGRRIARVLARSTGPTEVLVPLGGLSALDAPGQPFYDPEADTALFEALSEGLSGHPNVRLIFQEEHINDPSFAEAAARTLLDLMGGIRPTD